MIETWGFREDLKVIILHHPDDENNNMDDNDEEENNDKEEDNNKEEDNDNNDNNNFSALDLIETWGFCEDFKVIVFCHNSPSHL